jgi:hypothetical protein
MMWTRLYTRGLPDPIRVARIGEIESDLWEHARVAGIAGPQMIQRMALGVPSDLLWRRMHRSATSGVAADGKERIVLSTLKDAWWQVLAGFLGAWNLTVVFLANDTGIGYYGLLALAVAGPAFGLLLRRKARVAGDMLVIIGAVIGGITTWWLVVPIAAGAAVLFAAVADAMERPVAG